MLFSRGSGYFYGLREVTQCRIWQMGKDVQESLCKGKSGQNRPKRQVVWMRVRLSEDWPCCAHLLESLEVNGDADRENLCGIDHLDQLVAQAQSLVSRPTPVRLVSMTAPLGVELSGITPGEPKTFGPSCLKSNPPIDGGYYSGEPEKTAITRLVEISLKIKHPKGAPHLNLQCKGATAANSSPIAPAQFGRMA